MSEKATAVSPHLLTWARKISGLSLSDVAEYMHKDVGDIDAWESGSAWPTYNQLEHMAENLYKRPVALFFLPEPPVEQAPQQDFRTLPDFDIDSLTSDTRYAVRLARAYQESLRELTGGVNQVKHKLLQDINPANFPNVIILAKTVREYLGVTLSNQKSWRSTADAMAVWRSVIENIGIFVFKRSFKQREVSGFCLIDDLFPVIMINNSTPFTRQIFTLFHEIAHLLFGINSVTTLDGRFVERMSGTSQTIEVTCNQLAAEILVPIDTFPWEKVDRNDIIMSVTSIANDYNVSREVILRRVLDRGWINSKTYQKCIENWDSNGDFDREGGNYYYNQVAYLGESFLRLAFSRYRAGLISISELAEHIGIKAKHISKFEDIIASRL